MKTFDQYVKERPEFYVGLSKYEMEHDRAVWEAAQNTFDKLNDDVRYRALDAIDMRTEKWQEDARHMIYKAELLAELERIRKYIKELGIRRVDEEV